MSPESEGMSICRDCATPTGQRYAKYCPDHRWRHRVKPSTYKLTPEREAYMRAHYRPAERGISYRIAAVLQVPKWRVCQWAVELGLTSREGRKGPDWTPEQDAFLEQHLGSRHLHWIATQIGRSITAVVVRSKRLSLSRRAARDWYTARQVADGFGVDPSTPVRWVEQGKLLARREGQNHPDGRACMWRISHEALRKFARQHQTAYVLAKVDQTWFLDLVFGSIGKRDEAA